MLIAWIRGTLVLWLVVAAVGVATVGYVSLPSREAIARLADHPPQSTALIDARRRDHGKSWRIEQVWVPLSQVSPDVVHAVITAEDGTFYKHNGFDWYEVWQSLKRNWKEGRIVRGGSTITQQLAKNLFLSPSRDPMRKLEEFVITTRLEKTLSKNRILELYLNIVELGDGVFGVEAAARVYFDKHAGELTRDEAVRLAAIIPSPLRHNPTVDSRFVRTRSRSILARMSARGW